MGHAGRIEPGDAAAADHLGPGAFHRQRRVLVDADAELARVVRQGPEQAAEAPALREVLVDHRSAAAAPPFPRIEKGSAYTQLRPIRARPSSSRSPRFGIPMSQSAVEIDAV